MVSESMLGIGTTTKNNEAKPEVRVVVGGRGRNTCSPSDEDTCMDSSSHGSARPAQTFKRGNRKQISGI